MIKVCILDYGSGNVSSVKNLFDHLKVKNVVSNKIDSLKKSTHIVLPGVGAFGAAIKKIKKKIPFKSLENEVLVKNKPFLGICVGMQLLAESSEEFGSHKGFGWIQGNVKKIKSSKLPHIGWNDIKVKKKNKIIENLDVYRDFYFVNSFYFHPKKKENVVAETNYGQNFCSIVQKKNIIGVQFHPEKSQKAGQLIIKNFLKMR